jgi:hypothetical protein
LQAAKPSVTAEASPASCAVVLRCLPAQAVLQGWQLFIGLDLALKTWPALTNTEGWLEQEGSQSDLRGMRGTFVSGCIFAFLAVMNSLNTVATITEKRQHHQQRKQG